MYKEIFTIIIIIFFHGLTVFITLAWLANLLGIFPVKFSIFEPLLILIPIISGFITYVWRNSFWKIFPLPDGVDIPSFDNKSTNDDHLTSVKRYHDDRWTNYESNCGSDNLVDIHVNEIGELVRTPMTKEEIESEVSRSGPRIIIGGPGSGKSCLLQDIFFRYLTNI